MQLLSANARKVCLDPRGLACAILRPWRDIPLLLFRLLIRHVARIGLDGLERRQARTPSQMVCQVAGCLTRWQAFLSMLFVIPDDILDRLNW
jgi:hypothetical protein